MKSIIAAILLILLSLCGCASNPPGTYGGGYYMIVLNKVYWVQWECQEVYDLFEDLETKKK